MVEGVFADGVLVDGLFLLVEFSSLAGLVSLTVCSLTVFSLTISSTASKIFPTLIPIILSTTSSTAFSRAVLLLPTIRFTAFFLTILAPSLTVRSYGVTILGGPLTKLDKGEGAAGGADDSTASCWSPAPSFGDAGFWRGRRLGKDIG